jgi:tetratricopeptide (TPR) repeat protein
MGLLGAVGLLLAALGQKRVPYPYDLKRPANIAQAYVLIDAHPANAKAHLALARTLTGTAPSADWITELRAAVWLDPTNPYSRDFYAQALLQRNETAVALDEIARSVSNSPDLATHSYLNRRIVPWLTAPERNAIGAGFKFAVAHHYLGAVENFASYDDELGDAKAEASLYEAAAESAGSDARRAAYLESAGTAYLNAGEARQAEAAFRSAIAASPADSEQYVRLIDGVFGPARNWPAADALIAQAIGQGADPVTLYRALGQEAQSAGNYAAARDALQKALAARPADFTAIMQMGLLDLADNHPDRAATWFRRVAQLRPDSPEAFSDLGRAEEVAYEYFAADQAYRRAVAIAPGDGGLRERYAAFRRRVADNSKVHH